MHFFSHRFRFFLLHLFPINLFSVSFQSFLSWRIREKLSAVACEPRPFTTAIPGIFFVEWTKLEKFETMRIWRFRIHRTCRTRDFVRGIFSHEQELLHTCEFVRVNYIILCKLSMRARSNASEFKTHNEPLWSLEKIERSACLCQLHSYGSTIRARKNKWVRYPLLPRTVRQLLEFDIAARYIRAVISERQFASNRLIPKNIKNEYNNRIFWIEMHNMRVHWKDINACTYFSFHGFHPTRSVDVPKRRVVWGSIVRIYIVVYRSPYTSDMHHCQRYVTCNMRNFFPNTFMLKQTLDFVDVHSVPY